MRSADPQLARYQPGAVVAGPDRFTRPTSFSSRVAQPSEALPRQSRPTGPSPVQPVIRGHRADRILYFPLKNYNSDLGLGISGGTTASGTRAVLWTCNLAASQGWGFPAAATSGYVTAVNLHSDKCLDVSGASTSAGAAIIQWPCDGGRNQEWFLTRGTV